MNHHSHIINHKSPWFWTTFFLLVLLFLLGAGKWRSTATGAQVQVPMFYDAHYLFPRPWTQEQEAPGIPSPFPAAFYGSNTITQSFVSGANNLALVEVWLQGAPYGAIHVTLADETGPLYTGQVYFPERPSGHLTRFSFPTIHAAKGHTFWLTLTAADTTAGEPAVTHVIGGDRLDGTLRLNEYLRPGNLELHTYVSGLAAFDALAEQILPTPFRLRLQQFKPVPLKGAVFAILLVLTGGLTGIFLVYAQSSLPGQGATSKWMLAGFLGGFIIWQIGSGHVRLPLPGQATPLQAATSTAVSAVATHDLRVVNDLSAILWTAERLPEKRFVSTEIGEYPAIHVPATSGLTYAVDLPRNGRLHTGAQVIGAGMLQFVVQFNGEQLLQKDITAADNQVWLDIDLTPWQGQGGELRLITEAQDGKPEGLWLMPQLLAQTDWLLNALPAAASLAQYDFGADVVLRGFTITPAQPQPGDLVTVTLYWQGKRPLTQNATVFVHALTADGQMAAQSDGQPVQNTYPFTNWPPEVIIVDRHQFSWPDTAGDLAQLAVGLYDPATLQRWPVVNPDGSVDPNSQALLQVKESP